MVGGLEGPAQGPAISDCMTFAIDDLVDVIAGTL